MDNYINKIYMKGIYFILLLCLATIPSIGLVLDRDSLTQLTVWWFTFGIAIAIVEFCMFMNQEYMSSKECPIDDNTTWYTKDYPLSDMFSTKIWADGWKEYCKRSGDFRYLETMKGDFVPWIEFINGIIAVIFGIYIIYGITTQSVDKLLLALAIIAISSTQIFGTTVYFTSYYTKCFYKLKSMDALWWLHLVLMNGLWIIFPVIVINYAYNSIAL
tara:strand:+ start:1502 stop:2149 length:648 start_codon:yes stop_codon:yes gene_type:complete